MFTGRWPHQTGVSEDRPLDGTHPTLAEFLSDRGYLTAGLSATPISATHGSVWAGALPTTKISTMKTSSSRSARLSAARRSAGVCSVSRAFPWVSNAGGRMPRPSIMISRVVIRTGQGRPFFAFLNFFDAHTPYLLPEGLSLGSGLPCKTPPTRPCSVTGMNGQKSRSRRNWPIWPPIRTTTASHTSIQRSASCSTSLKGADLLNNTLIIITSDHGEHLGEHGLFGHGKSLYSQELHVPLVIIPPGGLVNGRVIRAPVSLRDLPATVADVLGYQSGSPFPSTSLARTGNRPWPKIRPSPRLFSAKSHSGTPCRGTRADPRPGGDR